MRFSDDFLGWCHHSEIGHGVVVTLQHHADDIFADVVDVAADGRDQEFSLAGASDFFGGHEGLEVCDGGFHHASRFHDLRKEHFSFAEKLTHYAHAVHQRALDDEERST